MMMDAKRLQTGEDSEKWVKHLLLGIVDELNKEKNLMTGLAPATAIKRKIVELKQKYPPEDVLARRWVVLLLMEINKDQHIYLGTWRSEA